jgi:hypothetical protein
MDSSTLIGRMMMLEVEVEEEEEEEKEKEENGYKSGHVA